MPYTLTKHVLGKNAFLSTPITAYYMVNYIRFGKPNNPDYLNFLKNNYENQSFQKLQAAYQQVYSMLVEALQQLKNTYGQDLVVMAVPRSKKLSHYLSKQLLFKKAVSMAANFLDLEDGTNYITRVISTKTTHLKNATNVNNEGALPYPGITLDTCHLEEEKIKGKHIILVDDIYTRTVNIDEDCIQALLDVGAKEVILFTIASTVPPQFKSYYSTL